MTSANNSNFTRGAQLWAHNMCMFLQGAKNICFLGLAFVLVLLLLTIRCYQYLTFETIYYFLIQCYVEFKLTFGTFFYPKHLIGIDYYSIGKGVFVHVGAEQFVYEFWHRTKYSVILNEFISWATDDALFEILVTFAVGCIFALILFTYKGRDILGIKKLRGSELVTVPQLRRILQRARQASKFKISGLPLVKNSETQHLLLTGTTGAGKTNMLNELLPQIRLKKTELLSSMLQVSLSIGSLIRKLTLF